MTTANIEKVIARKTSKGKSGWSNNQVNEIFKAELLKNVEKLAKVFPTVIISTFGDEGNILDVSFGVSYRSQMWTSGCAHVDNSSNNIALKLYGEKCIRTGFGATSAKTGYNGKTIPFSSEMTKPQLKRLFKQAIEQLVSAAYNKHSEFYTQENKVSTIWIDGIKKEITLD